MVKNKVSGGVVHSISDDLKRVITSAKSVHLVWEDITPLARNEWICWIESAKKIETRERRIRIMREKLLAGDRRPCCWAGCTHR